MKFFTDRTVENDFLLIKIKDYIRLREKGEKFSKWKEVYIDPGVYELKKRDEYSWRNLKQNYDQILDFLDSLPEKHYFSLDYPSDMNIEYQEYFLEKTWRMAKKYHSHSQYIVTVQSKFNNYWNFIECFDKYNNLDIKSGIMGLGNMCRFAFLNEYMKHVIPYAFKNCNHERIHIYGLCLRAIPYAYKLSKRFGIELTTDSTKWTRTVNPEFRKSLGENHRACCGKEERQLFFDQYLIEIRKRGVVLENGN